MLQNLLRWKLMNTRIVIATTASVILLLLGSTALLNFRILSETHFFSWQGSNERPADPPQAKYASELIATLRNLTRAAAHGMGASAGMSRREEMEWTGRNPCSSRAELTPLYGERKWVNHLPKSPLWEKVYLEYSRYHRACMRAVPDLKDYFENTSSYSGCKFLIADVAFGTGLGNKFFTLASSILYGIITARVVLVPSTTLVTNYTCEPFLGSSWKLDPAFPSPPEKFLKNHIWVLDKDYFRRVSAMMTKNERPAGQVVAYAAGVERRAWQPRVRFYCTTEQARYAQTTWMYTSGCIYTVPKLFATPFFRPLLEELFPDRVVMTRVLRAALLPADDVWDRTRRLRRAYLTGADHQLGVQVRYPKGQEQYEKMNNAINDRIMACMQSNRLGPERNVTDNAMVQVLVASLFPGLRKVLSSFYLRQPVAVRVVQITEEVKQEFSEEADRQALVEVLLLSLSEELLVSPMSTFGGLAQAFGALTPWFIDYRKEAPGPCERGRTVEPCNQYSGKWFNCSFDADVQGKTFEDVVSYIRPCPAVDHDQGIQLITKFSSREKS